jgi:2-methylcitrate dehydratase PrpD
MARSDFSGPDDILGGKDGLAAILSDTCDLKRLRRPDPDAYAISGIYVKPYAACRHCHAAIDAILRLRLTTAIQVDAIREIDVWTYRAAIHRHDHTEIFGVSSAKMSIPYSVAVALKYGRAGIGEFQDEIVQQEVIRQLTRKVRVSEDPALTALAPRVRAARVRVVTHDQRVYDEQVQHPKGEPENPISADELNDKFYALTQFAGRSRQDAERMATLVRAVDPRLPELFALLSR